MIMKDFDDALLDISWNNLCTEQSRYKDSDTKAVSLITIAGVLATLLIGFGTKDSSPGRILFAVSLLFLLFAVVFSTLSMVSRKTDVVSTRVLIDELEGEDPLTQVPRVIGTIANAEDSLRRVNEAKAEHVRAAVVCLSVAVIAMIGYSLQAFWFV